MVRAEGYRVADLFCEHLLHSVLIEAITADRTSIVLSHPAQKAWRVKDVPARRLTANAFCLELYEAH